MEETKEIFLEDLDWSVQQKVLDFYGVKKATDLNLDTFPLFVLSKETEHLTEPE